MKNSTKLLSLLLSLLMLGGVFSLTPAFAEENNNTNQPTADNTQPVTEPATEPETQPVTEPETQPVTEPETQPVTEPEINPDITVSAGDIQQYGFFTATQWALNTAAENATAQKPFTVTVPKGSYTADHALRVYSNTTLKLTGVTVKRVNGGTANLLRLGDMDSDKTGVTGYYYENISIVGGTFDGNATSGTVMKIAHAKNFSMTGVTLKNTQAGHIMEVGGVDGFTVKNCHFADQINTKSAGAYEAIQLDVLYTKHLSEYRCEDLPINNVLIENCTFTNVPRGIGSHTAVLNRPFNNIKIKKNTFTNIQNVAVQGQNWTNVEIADNTVDAAPRGFAIYSVFDGQGTFPSSAFAKAGNTTAHVSDKNQGKTSSHILISNNTIKKCGTINDTVAGYDSSGIMAVGSNLTQSSPSYNDGSGNLDKAVYPVSDITIRNNAIEEAGTGVRISQTKNAVIQNNQINLSANPFKTANYHGIYLYDDGEAAYIHNNTIRNAYTNGIYVYLNSKAERIAYNKIYSSKNYGISVDNATAGFIDNNTVSTTGSNGVQVSHAASVTGSVHYNAVSGANGHGMCFTDNSKVAQAFSNSITNYKNKNISVSYGATATLSNVKKAATDITPSQKTISVGKGDAYTLTAPVKPSSYSQSVTWSSSNTDIATVSGGKVTGKALGTANIFAKAANGMITAVFVTVTTPQKLAAPAVSLSNKSNGIRAEWKAINGAAKYKVFYRPNDAAAWSSAETANTYFPYLNTESGQKYAVQVQAISAGGNPGNFSAVKRLTFIAPPKFTASSYSGAVKLSWSESAGANQYQIARKKSGTSTYTYITVSDTNYTDSAVSGGTSYAYQVRPMLATATDGTAYGAWSSTATVSTLAAPNPSLSNKSNGIRAEWKAVSGAAKYLVYYKQDGANWSSTETKNTYFPYLNTKSGVKYCVQVRPVGTDGVKGSFSKVRSLTFIGQPSITSAAAGKKNVTLKWSSVAGANQYQIAKKKSGTSTYTYITVNTNSYTDAGVAKGTAYVYQIRAMYATAANGTAYGAWSGSKSVSVK